MRRPAKHRFGFTLVELLVVIAIIGILISLLLAALFKARALGEDLDARRDITELHKAVAAFANDPRLGSVGFVPSSISVGGNIDTPSFVYLQKLFPRCDINAVFADPGNMPGGSATLQGDQCLVFFLRGPAGKGWSTNPKNPLAPDGERIGPFFDFQPGRVQTLWTSGLPPQPIHKQGPDYPAYLDRFGSPIAYFCARSWNGQSWVPGQYNPGDCGELGGVVPYTQLSTTEHSYQLISAGRNKKFGTSGNSWTPDMARTVYPPSSDGADDIANFSNSLLGAKQ